MRSLSTLRRPPTRGFTLVEVMVTLAIVSTLLALGLFFSLEAYRGYTYRSDRTLLVALLLRARSHAMANIADSPWGLCKEEGSGDYLLFGAAAYAPAVFVDERVPSGSDAQVIGLPSCVSGAGIVFTALSGTTTATTLTITQRTGTSTISINEEGTIRW